MSAMGRWLWRILLLLVLLAALAWLWAQRMGTPEDFGPMEAQYKYGSIGADHPLAAAPLPYWIWKVLPEVLPPEKVIDPALLPRNGKPGLAAMGLVYEAQMPETFPPRAEGAPKFPRPVGFSVRRFLGVDLVGMNCAVCHAGTVTLPSPPAPAGSAPGPANVQHLVLGGVGHTVDIERYFLYVFSALASPDFNADTLMPAIDEELGRQKATLSWFQRLLYRWVLIPFLPRYAGALERDKFDFLVPDVLKKKRAREFGPGRVDTWALYKRIFVNPPDRHPATGTVDFPSIWNQKAREGMRLHWDGNTDVLVERNVISALGLIGEHVGVMDFERLTRVTEWITGLLPPRMGDLVPGSIDDALALKGAALFDQHCAGCHAPGGLRTGRVEPIEGLGTDPTRIGAFTVPLAASLNKLQTSQWQLRNFRVQNGYTNMLLDGIWLRGPYLHNGSVPTLDDLLAVPEQRPAKFCRGGDGYDLKKLGFVTEPLDAKGDCPNSWLMDTTKQGHRNSGHLYGTGLSRAEKDALLEFMKTL